MKTAFTRLLLPLIILTSSCGTGLYLSSSYVDDAYFSPSDKAVVVERRVLSESNQFAEEADIEEVEQVQEMEPVEGEREYVLVDSLSEQLIDEEGNVVVNNHYYYEPEEDWGYADRINRFHRPYSSFGYYDSGYYWDDWYSPYSYYSYGGYGFGYNPWYRGRYYSSWYSPYNYGYDYYYPYYSNYYSYNYGGHNWNSFRNHQNYTYGHRNSWVTDGPRGGASGNLTKNQLATARSISSPRSNSSSQKNFKYLKYQ